MERALVVVGQGVRAFDRDVPARGDDPLQRAHHVLVELDRVHALGDVGQCKGQGAETRPDLEHLGGRVDTGQAHDPASGVGVGQEVLPERTTRSQVVLGQQHADVSRSQHGHSR
jgi:hypothetical protein